MIDEDETVDLMSFIRPDASGERGGNPASSRMTSRGSIYPYDRPMSYGNQQYRDASGPIDGDAPGTGLKNAWEDLVVGGSDDLSLGDMGFFPVQPERPSLTVLLMPDEDDGCGCDVDGDVSYSSWWGSTEEER